jgi:hypothetical protein
MGPAPTPQPPQPPCASLVRKRGVNCCARFLGGVVRGRFGVGGIVEVVSVAGAWR